MSPGNLQAILFVAASLAANRLLDFQTRARIISCAGSFDIHAETEAAEGLGNAYRGAKVDFSSSRSLARKVSKAANQAENWIENGIAAIVRPDPDPLAAQAHGIPNVLFCKGDPSLLQQPIAAVLNSRKPRRTVPGDTWIAATRRLVAFARDSGFAMASSYGNIPYSLVTSLAKGSPTVIVCGGVLPFMQEASVLAEFESLWGDLFDWAHTLFVSPFPPGTGPRSAAGSALRDQLVAALASVLLVAGVRRGGNMALIIEAARKRGISLGACAEREAQWWGEADFLVPRQTRADGSVSFRIEQRTPRSLSAPQAVEALMPADGILSGNCRHRTRDGLGAVAPGFLFHYTRSCPGPWPGQTMYQYCRSLIQGDEGAAHTGFDTLMRILSQGVIRGSSRLTRGCSPVVSFTESGPWDLKGLIRWRTGLIRWSFEPYGIGVRRDALLGHGAKQVVYGDEAAYRVLPERSKHLFQLQDRAGADWTAEREWRVKGDLFLDRIAEDDLVVVVPAREEAEMVERAFGAYRVLCLDEAGLEAKG